MDDASGKAPSSAIRIAVGGLDDRRVIALLERHLLRARAGTAVGSAHALDSCGLRAPDVTFWSLWVGEEPLAIGALRGLPNGTGEIKSMFTSELARRRGLGGTMLAHVVERARAMGLIRLCLETGSWPYFDAARAMYRAHGFTDCEPFGDYRADPASVFMERSLQRP